MHPTGSLILSAVETIRLLLNEATSDAKYDDQYIVRTALASSLSSLLSRCNQVSEAPIYVRHQIDLVTAQEYYQLPPHILQVMRIAKFDDLGILQWDWKPRGEFHPFGPGWRLEGSTLRINPYPLQDETIHLWYIPSASFNSHYSETGVAPGTTNISTFTLSQSPTVGLLGRAENEYAGAILRVLDDGVSGTHYERVISSYDPTTRVATLRLPIPTLSKTTTLKYEVVPAGSLMFWDAAASMASTRIGTGRKITRDHMADIMRQHAVDMKTLRDTLFQMQGRIPKHIDRMTIDNPELTVSFDKDLGPRR